MKLAEFGVVGLGVMGANLARNAASKGYLTAVYERDEGLRAAFRRESPDFPMAERLEDLPGLIRRPRRILLMVRAGAPVDSVLDTLLPALEPGDVVIDGGNSHWRDTDRRVRRAEAAGLWFSLVQGVISGHRPLPDRRPDGLILAPGHHGNPGPSCGGPAAAALLLPEGLRCGDDGAGAGHL